jgi:hypothetical protein
MTLAAVKPGGWSLYEVLRSSQMTALQNELVKAVDGVNGGTYTLEAPLVFDGAEVQFEGGARIPSGAILHVNDGGKIDVHGAGLLEISLAATLALQGTLTLTGDINVQSGGDINVKGSPGTPGRIDVESAGVLHLEPGAVFDIDSDMALGGTLDVVGGAIRLRSAATLTLEDSAAIALEDSAAITLQDGAQLLLTIGASIALSTGTALVVDDDAELLVRDSAILGVLDTATLTLQNSATLTLADSAQMLLTTGTSLVAGNNAFVQVEDANDLRINDSIENFRLAMTPVWIQLNAATGAPRWLQAHIGRWVQTESVSVGLYEIAFALPFLPGDTITSLNVMFDGGPALPATKPRISIVKVAIDGTVSSPALAATVDGSASAAAYDGVHFVSLNAGTATTGAMPITLTSDPHYLVVRGEQGGTDDTLQILSISGGAVARSFRSSSMVYN